ncbi:hypothetical protein N665_0026s0069 [Sinapis alba]|nr:hypothetical protein N665_0026s0069 [Sinapis alba]
MDSMLASVEAECWRKANLPEDEEEEEARSALSVSSTLPVDPQPPTFQINTSWINDGAVSGLRWFYKDPIGAERFGLQGCRKSLSALHAEMEGLIWTMSCLRELHCTTVHMEMDSSDMVDMIANPSDWPAIASELVSFRLLQDGFLKFSIACIPMIRNLRANSFAKEVRCSGTLFSHIDQTQTDITSLRNDPDLPIT